MTLIVDRMTREEVLGLRVACDASVSLHRWEGFRRCIAEAMAYGEPVIVTNYSGSRTSQRGDMRRGLSFRSRSREFVPPQRRPGLG